MSDTPRRLPARPSLEQLRKQARESLHELRRENPSARLADAQYALARSYGFESWPRLVHHVGLVTSSERLSLFEQLAQDLFAGYHGDEGALERLGAWFGDSYSNLQRLERVRDRIDGLRRETDQPRLEDVQTVVARQFGFDTWTDLAAAITRPTTGSAVATGRADSRALYRIDELRGIVEVQPPLTNRDWDDVFAIMEERGLTGISTSAITDSAMERLSRLDFVTTLHFGGARALSDDGFRHVANMPQVEHIDLSGWHSRITDRGLEALARVSRLKTLTLCWPQRITDAGVASLAACERLERVDLMGTPTGDGAIAALRGKPGLHVLKTGKLVTDAGIPLLHEFPAFTTTDVPRLQLGLMDFGAGTHDLMLDGPFTDTGLATLAGLDGVLGLNFFWHTPAFTPAGLARLAHLPNLRYLGIDGKRCDDTAMRHISEMPALRMLMAQGTEATDDGFIALSQSRTVEYLWGRECPNLGSRGFRALARMPSLKGLAVSCLAVDDAALASLPDFPALTDFMPMDVSDDGFRHVGRCRKIERLWCMYCRDTGDAATMHVADLRLKLYYAGKTRITDRSMEILARMHSLEKIQLWEVAGVTDAGVAALAALPNLRELSIDGSPNVTRAGLRVFPDRVRITM